MLGGPPSTIIASPARSPRHVTAAASRASWSRSSVLNASTPDRNVAMSSRLSTRSTGPSLMDAPSAAAPAGGVRWRGGAGGCGAPPPRRRGQARSSCRVPLQTPADFFDGFPLRIPGTPTSTTAPLRPTPPPRSPVRQHPDAAAPTSPSVDLRHGAEVPDATGCPRPSAVGPGLRQREGEGRAAVHGALRPAAPPSRVTMRRASAGSPKGSRGAITAPLLLRGRSSHPRHRLSSVSLASATSPGTV